MSMYPQFKRCHFCLYLGMFIVDTVFIDICEMFILTLDLLYLWSNIHFMFIFKAFVLFIFGHVFFTDGIYHL